MTPARKAIEIFEHEKAGQKNAETEGSYLHFNFENSNFNLQKLDEVWQNWRRKRK